MLTIKLLIKKHEAQRPNWCTKHNPLVNNNHDNSFPNITAFKTLKKLTNLGLKMPKILKKVVFHRKSKY